MRGSGRRPYGGVARLQQEPAWEGKEITRALGEAAVFLDNDVLVLLGLGQITVLCPPWPRAPSSMKWEQYLFSGSHWAVV